MWQSWSRQTSTHQPASAEELSCWPPETLLLPLSEPTWVVLFLSFCCFGLDKQPLMDCWSCKTVLSKIDSVSRKASKSFRQSFPTCLQRTSAWIVLYPQACGQTPSPGAHGGRPVPTGTRCLETKLRERGRDSDLFQARICRHGVKALQTPLPLIVGESLPGPGQLVVVTCP